MSTTFNTLDLIFFAFTAIFVLTAVFRGFVKEVFALLNWVISLTVSYLLTPFITDFLSAHFQSKLAIDLVARSGLFVLVFFITAMSTAKMRDSLYEKMPRAFDRSLGLLFGFCKTLLIFGLIYSIYLNVCGFVMGNKLKDEVKEPQCLQEAKSRSLIKASGDVLDPVVKKFFAAVTKNFDQILPKKEDLLDDKINEIVGDGNSAGSKEKNLNSEDVSGLSDSELAKTLDTGYSKKNIEKLNQLIEVVK